MVPDIGSKNSIKHLAIIMDGNGRWAKSRGLNRSDGHKKGAEKVRELLEYIQKYNIEYLTLYAFSTENWKRPRHEINSLMNLLKSFLEINREVLIQNDVRLRVIGRIKDIPFLARKTLQKVINETAGNRSGQLILALSYSGRAEIVDAVKKISNDVKSGKLNNEDINEEVFSQYLYAPDVPPPDLMIRTSGEYRISNFLLWELSYTELWITDVLWPDFSENELRKALEDFDNRKRRFGGI